MCPFSKHSVGVNTHAHQPRASLEPLEQLLDHRAPNNPKLHDLDAIRASIARFGFVAPVLVDETEGLVAEGHGRLEALELMCLEDCLAPDGIQVDEVGRWLVPTVHVSLAPGQADAYRIASNRTVELGGWDQTKLADLLAKIASEAEGLTGVGFTRTDMNEQIAAITANPARVKDPEALPSVPPERAVHLKPGDFVGMGAHRLLVGDATESASVERAAGALRGAALCTDPPYGVAYTGGTDERLTILNDNASATRALLSKSFSAVNRVLVPGAAVYVFHPAGPLSMVFGEEFCRVGWSYRQSLVWVKNSLVLGRSDYQYRHEPILYGFKPGPGRLGRGGKSWYGGNDASSVFEVPRPNASRDHPTAKPVRLIELMLRNSTRRGDVVIDPFAGSGSTLIACELLGRTFVGLELDPRYAQVIVDRWETYTGRRAVVESSVE